jgi:hypothetical protein
MESVTTSRPWSRLREGEDYVWLVYGLVLVWGFGDVVSTYFAYAVTGTSSMEANPWIGLLLAHDPLWVVVLKGAVVLYAGVVLLACRPVVERVPGWQYWLGGVVCGGIVVVVNNLAVGAVILR